METRVGTWWTLGAALLVGCGGEGSWSLEIWGEDYIAEGIPAEAFADGCEVTFERFQVVVADRALLSGDEEEVGALGGAEVWELTTEAEPAVMGTVTVPADFYDRLRAAVRPDGSATAANVSADDVATLTAAGGSIRVAGGLTCGGTRVDFDWTFDTSTSYLCEPDALTVPKGGAATSQLTLHGDHLFYDDLESPDAAVRGEAIVAADTNSDGTVTQAELAAVSVPALGYGVGSQSDVSNLDQFIASLTRSLGHVDGEGHCQVR